MDPKTTPALLTGISDYQGKSWRYYKTGANKILHSRNVTFLREVPVVGGDADNFELGESVVPPAEGEEMTHTDIAAEQQSEHDASGREKSDLKIEKPSEQTTITADQKDEHTLSNSTAQVSTSKPSAAPSVPPSSKRSKLSMPKTPASILPPSLSGRPAYSTRRAVVGVPGGMSLGSTACR